ncbi:CbtB domain-containing protein [Rhodovibrio salinarum]|uniref:Cobalt transporter subunit CbtB n=2 Tax=Rhodovibrio salinarum TaxID=1087 RepID=A0A934QKK8_9PROT|nr:hypothetical protein [Rhodovibrio salinarum]
MSYQSNQQSAPGLSGHAGTHERTQILAAAFAAILFGVVLIAGVGFASPTTIHNAAHDSRHAFAFPCH